MQVRTVTIEVKCPGCEALLRIGDDQAGRQTRCPRCSTVFQSPDAVPGGDSSPSPPPIPDSPASSDPSTPESGSSSQPGTAGGTTTPPESVFGGAPAGHVDASNPYAPTSVGTTDRAVSPGWAPRVIGFDEVFHKSWAIFKEQWLMACVAIVITGAINTALNIAQEGAVRIAGAAGDEQAAVLVGIFLGFARWLVQIWLQIGVTLVMLDIARGKQVVISKVFGGAPYLLHTALALILFSMAIGGIALVMVGLPAAAVGLATQDPASAGIAAVIGLLVALVPMAVVSLMLSQVQLLVVDRGVNAIESLRLSMEITRGNKLTIFVIGIALMGIGILAFIAGLLALCIGVIPAMIGMSAFASLVLVVTYLSMTGQEVVTERSYIGQPQEFGS